MAARTRLLVTMAVLVTAGWLALLALRYPFPYQVPAELPELVQQDTHLLFVHGTLRSAVLRFALTGRYQRTRSATLPDFRREGLDVLPSQGEVVQGWLLEIGSGELARLDRYERLGDRYWRDCLPLDDGRRAWVYRRINAMMVPHQAQHQSVAAIHCH
jgi:gamma-glutamylcyclotransferase (GGCT)/AIG2-like uncharacterized protein YtfP